MPAKRHGRRRRGLLLRPRLFSLTDLEPGRGARWRASYGKREARPGNDLWRRQVGDAAHQQVGQGSELALATQYVEDDLEPAERLLRFVPVLERNIEGLVPDLAIFRGGLELHADPESLAISRVEQRRQLFALASPSRVTRDARISARSTWPRRPAAEHVAHRTRPGLWPDPPACSSRVVSRMPSSRAATRLHRTSNRRVRTSPID